jgi:hypothetical protein
MAALMTLAIAGICLGGGADAPASACGTLDPEVRKAIAFHIQAFHATGEALSEDQGELVWAMQAIREHGRETLPCLVEVFRHGLGGTGLWTYGGAPPKESRWVISKGYAMESRRLGKKLGGRIATA